MKMSAKLLVILLAASMGFSTVGCKGEPPEPPIQVGQADTTQSGIEISVVSFELATPDFIDREGHAMRPSKDEAEVAVLRLKIKNTSGSEMQYKPLHFEAAAGRVQVCTEPDPETGARTDIKAIAFEAGKGTHTPGQLAEATRVAIPAGGEIVDEYLFEPPVVAGGQKLIVLVPGSVVGVQKTFRFYLDMPKPGVQAEPSKLNVAAVVDNVSVTVTKVGAEYPELEPVDPPAKQLLYPYAYTSKPVLAIHIKIENNSSTNYGYDPSHTAEIAGINLNMPGNISLKRVKLENRANNAARGKGQVHGKVALTAGESLEDVYFFDLPVDSTPLEFSLSGHIFGVRGIYRFALNYTKSTPPEPDLTPYKSAGKADNAANAENNDSADAPADSAEAEAPKADENKDAEPKPEENKG